MADHLRSELVVDALEMATSLRRPGAGLVHHSDQGSQYISLAFTRRLPEAGIAGSMGGVGSAFDNAAAESLFRHDQAGAGEPPQGPHAGCGAGSGLRVHR